MKTHTRVGDPPFQLLVVVMWVQLVDQSHTAVVPPPGGFAQSTEATGYFGAEINLRLPVDREAPGSNPRLQDDHAQLSRVGVVRPLVEAELCPGAHPAGIVSPEHTICGTVVMPPTHFRVSSTPDPTKTHITNLYLWLGEKNTASPKFSILKTVVCFEMRCICGSSFRCVGVFRPVARTPRSPVSCCNP